MIITGTFIDEITHDIPSQNWGPDEWAADFEVMRAIGIDTVILIRSGYRDQAVFNSWALRKHRPMLPARQNLAELFLDLAAKNGMKLLWGIYDPGDWDINAKQALQINHEFMLEVNEQFGGHDAFAGWYLTFELSRHNPQHVELVLDSGRHAKKLTPNLPTMISPYISGTKAPPGMEPISRSQHEDEWQAIFHKIKECVDIVAFQDGHVDFLEAPEYLVLNTRLAREAGIACWSNVESFDRDMPIKFPPIDWRKLEYKIDVAREAGVDKLITFEFSHFMSPNSVLPAARNLFDRYCERFKLNAHKQAMKQNG
ncbi:MAG: DUF4434 domain-containing protein [Phycisphaerae bacterium]|nr:DUF4434 domain-containing protein [Phycisphaerales bacterium]